MREVLGGQCTGYVSGVVLVAQELAWGVYATALWLPVSNPARLPSACLVNTVVRAYQVYGRRQ